MMDFYAPKGTRVVFTGNDHGRGFAAKHLTVGETYTVDWTDVRSMLSPVVFLRERPGIAFNSVHFDTAPAPGSETTAALRGIIGLLRTALDYQMDEAAADAVQVALANSEELLAAEGSES